MIPHSFKTSGSWPCQREDENDVNVSWKLYLQSPPCMLDVAFDENDHDCDLNTSE